MGLVGPGVFGDGVPGMDVCACPDTANALARFIRLPLLVGRQDASATSNPRLAS